MKKVIWLAAFALLGGSIVSCDNDKAQAGSDTVSFNTDDGLVPPKPPKPPFPLAEKG